MPTRARSRGNSQSQARRTNWIAWGTGGSSENVAANSVETFVVLDPSDPTSEVGKYVDPTLIRVRGSLICDGDFSGNPGSQYAHTYFALYVGPAELDFTIPGGGAQELAAWSSDRIIWSGAAGAAVFNVAPGSAGYFSVFQDVQTVEIDTKAMRRLEDDNKLYMAVINAPATTPVSFTCLLRCLLKE